MRKLKILVVSHDAGGANILSSLVKKYRKNFHWANCITGPAKKIFLSKQINLYADSVRLRNGNFVDVLNSVQPDFLLTGTGWGSNFEINFIKQAKKMKIKTASFLEHWGGYRERFGYPRKWVANLPDFLFVGDKWSYKVALESGFSKDMLFHVENPYFEEIIQEAQLIKKSKLNNDKKIKILYLSQPVLEHALKQHNNPYYWGYTEYEIFENLLKAAHKLRGMIIPLELKIRFHPSEKINKYDKLLDNKSYAMLRSCISRSKPEDYSLVEDCIWADVVIGSDTVALVIAFLVGKRAVSYAPNKKSMRSLPEIGIKKVSSIDEIISYFNYIKNTCFKYKEKPRINMAKNNNLFARRIYNILRKAQDE